MLESGRTTHTTADLLYDALYIAGIGGGVVALFFLAWDVLVHGDPLFTPSLMGTVLFESVPAEAVHSVSMPAVAKFTAVHMALFGLFGLAVSWLTHQAEIRSRNPVLVIGLLFAAIEIGFWIATSVLIPGVLVRIGVLPVAIANLLAAVGVGLFLYSSHQGDLWARVKRQAGLTRVPRT
jgi:hypothetical protein